MSATVLVVEYEPRYLDRLRHAFAGRPLTAVFTRDGAEALEALRKHRPDVIVLSWILPKTSTADLIRAIRATEEWADLPILLTVSGYNGRDSHSDARRVGATDLLPKPFTESDLLARLAELTGIDPLTLQRAEHEMGDFSIDLPQARQPAAMHEIAAEGGKLTSDEIFSGVLDEDQQAPSAPLESKESISEARHEPKKMAEEDLDELLNQTLISLKKKKKAEPQRDASAVSELDRLVEDTLSGLPRRKKKEGAPRADEPFAAAGPEDFDRVPSSSPVVPLEPDGDETFTAKPGARIGQFVLRERIATGGMAEIWKARMEGVEGFEKFVAIKRILPHLAADQEFVDMFINEAKIAARLNHPNIIHIYDLGRASGTYYIAMELVDGHDLKTALRQAGERGLPISLELAVFIASKVAAALDFAHRKEEGLVHRDVSPQNVLISWEGDIKLCDFGIAKATSKVSHTQSGALKGKIQYMSPEQASGKAIDRRSDVFSLGVVLFEMLTGKKLFHGDSEISVLDQVRDARTTVPSEINDEVPADIDAVVLKALAKDPEQRFASAGEMARALDKALYAFRPTPGAADLAVWMHHLWREEPAPEQAAEPEIPHSQEEARSSIVAPMPARQPVHEPAPAHPAPAARTVAAHTRHAHPAAKAAPPPRRRGVWILAALITVAALGGGGAWLALQRGSGAEPAAATVATASLSQPSAPRQTVSPEPVDVAAAPELIATDPTAILDTAPSPDLVTQEVERRLESERARLEALRRQEERSRQRTSEAAPTSVPAPPSSEAAAQPPRAAVTRAEVPPAAAEPSATPVPTESETPPRTTPARPAAGDVVASATETASAIPPVAPPVRRGDLVEPGTAGLVEPQLVSLRRVSYPPMAKMRRVEGIVVIRVLVSETGEVLEANVLRGVTPDFGIDQAAMEAIRGGSFRPATKDGVPVKAYKTITVPFKL